MSNEKLVLTWTVSLAALVLGYISYSIITAKKYFLRSKVRKLMIYPIKSLPGVEVQQLEFHKSFLKYKNFYDRSWLLIDEENRMITQRKEAKLAKIKVNLLEDEILLEADNMEPIKIPNSQSLKKDSLIHSVNIWGEKIDGQDCGEQINNWFSIYLGKKVKLIKHQSEFGFRKSKKLTNGKLVRVDKEDQLILYSDGAPLLIINEKSVEDLNKRIQKDYSEENPAYVNAERFRPNIFFETDKAFEEDQWRFMKIGNSEFEFLIECGRCKLTTLNADTLEYEEEPLRTLKKYRMGPKHIFGESPKLGIYFKPIRISSKINVGDDIFASF